MKEFGQVNGRIRLRCYDKNGFLIDEKVSNTVQKIGIFHMLDNFYDRTNVNPITTSAYCVLGTGSIVSDRFLSGLQVEVSGTGNPGRATINDVSRTSQTILYSTYFDTTKGSGTITEAGIFGTGYSSGGNLKTASITKDSGIMCTYATFAGVTKSSTSTMTVDWEISI